jgi:hypothetical protein
VGPSQVLFRRFVFKTALAIVVVFAGVGIIIAAIAYFVIL